ncbi:hypothetical protein [Actinokineospora globicatena]|uniref:Uncharacterized protein n=1 Tax=Actinokineospora globicatena TaxID=103729 RepID=A0A9W6V8U7_9PSEU|nr:hypothetical protein [Actinokineospora globicatena]GLW90288.1 hypothetical protein Aglo03_11040 [Actinokineospora globicatena]
MSTSTLTVPYITKWSTEQTPLSKVARHRSGRGIAYVDETIGDRDSQGVLWARANSAPRVGRPLFGQVHPLRQRRAMRRLLCQVCGEPADRNDDGVLWLLLDHREDWPGWPEDMFATEPPICRPCVDLSTRLCPALRRGHVLVRSRNHEIAGVRGPLYRPNRANVVEDGQMLVPYGDPMIPWTLAHDLARELHDCSIVD